MVDMTVATSNNEHVEVVESKYCESCTGSRTVELSRIYT